MSLNRWAARRDANEDPIVEALRHYGVWVWKISGKGKPDILCRYQGRWMPLEIKSAAGRRTKAQAVGLCPWPVVRTLPEALQALGVPVPAPARVALGSQP